MKKSGRWGPYRQASSPPARHRPGARSARLGDVPSLYRKSTSNGRTNRSTVERSTLSRRTLRLSCRPTGTLPPPPIAVLGLPPHPESLKRSINMPRLRVHAFALTAFGIVALCLALTARAERDLATAKWVKATAYVVP